MEFNYFSDAAAQPYQMYGFGSEASSLPQTSSNDATPQYPAMQIDSLVSGSSMLRADFSYKFDTPTIHESSVQPILPHSQTSPSDQFPAITSSSLDSGIGLDFDGDMQLDRRASSEEKDLLTPAQSRRKAQNRAAQRAFRERKERHVRDLEAKLNLLTTTTSSLQSDNERLKALLQKTQTENQLLRATAATSPASQPSRTHVEKRRSAKRTSTEDSSASSSGDQSSAARSRSRGVLSTQDSFTSESSQSSAIQASMLSASATWDLLQNHPRYTSGCVDVGKVCERLKTLAQCQSSGPMFDENEVRKILDEVGGNGADELI